MQWDGPTTLRGVQIIRSAAILQLLLGNMGRPVGGILALRGQASIQGSSHCNLRRAQRGFHR